VYIQQPPAIAIQPNDKDYYVPAKDELLVSWIKVKIQEECRVALTKQLDMHLSVVVDEAGAPEWNGFCKPRRHGVFHPKAEASGHIRVFGHLRKQSACGHVF
jgi:hypothetical protein